MNRALKERFDGGSVGQESVASLSVGQEGIACLTLVSMNRYQRIIDQLEALGIKGTEIKEFPSSTRTAQDAAATIGCSVAEIAKSLVFEGERTGAPVIVILSGARKVSESLLNGFIGEGVKRATPEFVREQTGYAIGGVPPCGHNQKIRTIVDSALLGFKIVWAAAGTPNAVFSIAPQDLVKASAGEVAVISK